MKKMIKCVDRGSRMIVVVAVFKCCSYFKDWDGRDDQTVNIGNDQKDLCWRSQRGCCWWCQNFPLMMINRL